MINRAALDLIREFEGFRAEAYLDTLAKPPIVTIGYGTTARAGVGISPKLGMKITEAQAVEYLNLAVIKFAEQIASKIKRPINENQFGAFVSLAYNIGPSAFAKSSALRRFNEGDALAAADAIRLWEKAGGKVVRGLQRRRAAERALFLTPVAAGKPAPAPIPGKPKPPATSGLIWATLAALWAKITKG